MKIIVWAVVSLLLLSTSARALEKHSLNVESTSIGRMNPIGLVESFNASYRYRLYQNETLLLKNNFIEVSLLPRISPAYAQLGGGLALQPLSILKLSASAHRIFFFGTFDTLQSWPTRSDAIAPDASEVKHYAASGNRFDFSLLLQSKYKNFAFRNTAQMIYYDMTLQNKDTVWQDPILSTLVPAHGWAFTNDLDALYLPNSHFIFGLRYSLTQVIHSEQDPTLILEPTQHKLGPFIAYTFYQRKNTSDFIEAMSLFTLLQWQLAPNFKEDSTLIPALPTAAIGFQLQTAFI